MNDGSKQPYVNLANKIIERGEFLANKLYDELKKVNGSATWEVLVTMMENIVSQEKIRRHITSIPDFTYRANRIYPLLDAHAKLQGVNWSHGFWVFWESVKKNERKYKYC